MVRRRKGAERDQREAPVAAEALQQARQRMPPVNLRRSIGAHNEGWRGAEAPHHVLKRLDRDLGFVEVFEEERDWPAAGEARQRARQQLKDLCPVGARGTRRRRDRPAGGGSDLAHFVQHRKERDQVAREIRKIGRRAAATVAPAEVVLDEVAEALVRERAILLDGPAVQHANLPRLRQVLELVEQPRLADARLSPHEHELALAGDGGVQPQLKFRRLFVPADERGEHSAAAAARIG